MSIYEHQDHEKHARHFCDIHNVGGTVLLDEKSDLAGTLGIRGIPINVVFDKKGIIKAFGMTSPKEVESGLRRLMVKAALPFG